MLHDRTRGMRLPQRFVRLGPQPPTLMLGLMILISYAELTPDDLCTYDHIWVLQSATTMAPGAGMTTFVAQSIFDLIRTVAEHHPDGEILIRAADVLHALRQGDERAARPESAP